MTLLSSLVSVAGPQGVAGSAVDPSARHDSFDDLVGELSSSAYQTDWYYQNSGTGAATARVAVAGRPGVFRCTTGTTTTGYSRIIRGGNGTDYFYCYLPSTTPTIMEGEFRISALPDATNQWTSAIGMRDSFNTTSVAAGGITWDTGTSAARFQLITRTSGGALTTGYGVTTPVANTWYRYKLEITNTSVIFSIKVGGAWVVQVTNTTNLPDTGLTPYLQASKVASTTSRYAEFDWIWVYQAYSAGRPA